MTSDFWNAKESGAARWRRSLGPGVVASFVLLTASLASWGAPATPPAALGAGDHRRALTVDGRARSYLVHVPAKYDAAKPTPVVLAFHGALMNAPMMVGIFASSSTDRARFASAS